MADEETHVEPAHEPEPVPPPYVAEPGKQVPLPVPPNPVIDHSATGLGGEEVHIEDGKIVPGPAPEVHLDHTSQWQPGPAPERKVTEQGLPVAPTEEEAKAGVLPQPDKPPEEHKTE